jgi:phage terminase large subunit
MNKNIEVLPAYVPLFESTKKYNILYGGRGSGKSYAISDCIALLYFTCPGRNMLALRRYGNTVKNSVYNDLASAISRLGIKRFVKINKTERTFTFSNGNQIVCGGLDDGDKWKSLRFENGDLSDIWFEEADQITEKSLNDIVLTMRGNVDNKKIFISFNPTTKNHWLYKRFFEVQDDDVLTLQTCYLDNPYCSKDIVEELEKLKVRDPDLYYVIGLGNWGVLKDTVYRNYKVQQITLDESYYDNIMYGLDFGYNDPCCCLKVGFKDGNVYVLDELYKSYLIQEELYDLMLNDLQVPYSAVIKADHEKDRIADLKRRGYKYIGLAEKTNKENAVVLLSSKNIYIHPNCVNTIREIGFYRWRKDPSTDEPIEKLEDGNDHTLDALLYACRDWLKNQKNVSKRRVGGFNISL